MVLGGIALLIFGLNYLKGLDLLAGRNTYVALYNDVSGISDATPVLFHGYQVGKVVSSDMLFSLSVDLALSAGPVADGRTVQPGRPGRAGSAAASRSRKRVPDIRDTGPRDNCVGGDHQRGR